MTTDAQAAFGEPPAPKRRSALGYWLAGLVATLAVAGAVVWFVHGIGAISDAVDGLARVPIPGSRVVRLQQGSNAVYYEGGDGVPALRIAIRAVGGAPVDVGPHGGETTYDVGDHHGRSIAGFTAPAGGAYRVTVRGPAGGVIAVGKGVGGRIVRAVVGGLAVFFGGLLLSGVLIIVTARGRRTPGEEPGETPDPQRTWRA